MSDVTFNSYNIQKLAYDLFVLHLSGKGQGAKNQLLSNKEEMLKTFCDFYYVARNHKVRSEE